MDGDDRARWSWPLVRRSARITTVCLLVGGGIGYAMTHQPASSRRSTDGNERAGPKQPPTAGPAELALLAPLEVGGSLEDCAVSRIDAVHDGRLAVVCTLGSASIELDVCMASAEAPPAPATSGPYAVYYSAEPSASANATRLALALAQLLDTHVSEPRPDGLAPFHSH